MKKGWKIVGALAALAALLPYSVKKDDENEKLTVQALLWKYTSQPDHETPDRRNISIDIGFQKPMAEENDDLIIADTPSIEEDTSTCYIEPSSTPKPEDEPETPVQSEI